MPGDIVTGRIYLNPGFAKKEYGLRIKDVRECKIRSLSQQDFRDSDMGSAENLKQRFEEFYQRIYGDDDNVRVIDFEYAD